MVITYRGISYADFLPKITSANSDKNYTMKIQKKEVALLLSTQMCKILKGKASIDDCVKACSEEGKYNIKISKWSNRKTASLTYFYLKAFWMLETNCIFCSLGQGSFVMYFKTASA